jgi:membrane-bound ClpP family serine protease
MRSEWPREAAGRGSVVWIARAIMAFAIVLFLAPGIAPAGASPPSALPSPGTATPLASPTSPTTPTSPITASAAASAPASATSTAAGGPTAANTAAPFTPPTIQSAGVVASRQANNVAIITIRGEIDGSRSGRSVMAESVRRRIRTAERAGANAIIFDIDSPGGEVGATLGICKAIRGSSIKNTIAWINPNAYSGGAIIALACREIVVNDPASFGDAMPILAGPGGATGVPEDLRKKMLPPLIEELLTSTRAHNEHAGSYVRDEYLVLSVVANDVELWWARHRPTGTRVAIDRVEFEALFPSAPRTGATRLAGAPGTAGPADPSSIVVDQIPGQPPVASPAGSRVLASVIARAEQNQSRPSSRPVIDPKDRDQWELLGKITDGTAAATFSASDLVYYGFAGNPSAVGPDGRLLFAPVASDADIKALLGAKHVVRLDRTWSEGLVLFLTNIVVRGVLIILFLMAFFVEMTHPGAFLPGIVALIALAALIAPPMLIGMASWWEVAAILVGMALLCLEIFVLPGFGVAGGIGLLSLLGGLIATFIPAGQGLFPDSPQGQSNLMWAAVTIVLALGTAGIGIYLLSRHLPSLPIFNKMILKNPGTESDEESMFAPMLPMDDDPPARVGEMGVAMTALRPVGRVAIDDRVFDAVSVFGYMGPGSRVRVVEVSGFRVGVEPLDPPVPQGGATPEGEGGGKPEGAPGGEHGGEGGAKA